MKESVKAFLTEVIDYAGFFPPEDLSLKEAFQHYNTYRSGSDAWILSRFIVLHSRLADLSEQALSGSAADNPARVSVLGAGTQSNEEFREMMEEVERESTRINPDVLQLDVLETKLPERSSVLEQRQDVQTAVEEARTRLQEKEMLPRWVFFETHLSENWRKRVEVLAGVLSEMASTGTGEEQAPVRMGFKLRCGGQDPDLIPSVEQVAYVINRCKEGSVPMKFTAGLHHPFRTYNDSVSATNHGFVNVLGGAILSNYHDLDDEELQRIIGSEKDQFSFSESVFRWKELRVPAEGIKRVRSDRVRSFGSCSFDEPREDLRNEHLLEG